MPKVLKIILVVVALLAMTYIGIGYEESVSITTAKKRFRRTFYGIVLYETIKEDELSEWVQANSEKKMDDKWKFVCKKTIDGYICMEVGHEMYYCFRPLYEKRNNPRSVILLNELVLQPDKCDKVLFEKIRTFSISGDN